MELRATAIKDVVLITPRVFDDERGFFMETWSTARFAEAGLAVNFVQDNHSHSLQGVLRGLHYQSQHAQGKLVRVIGGEIFDVAVDLRRSSPTFRRWVGIRLSAESRQQLWIPAGFAHGYYTLSGTADVLYKCTDIYAPAHEHTLIWNDPELKLEWPLLKGQVPRLSVKDAQGKPLREAWCYP